MIIFIILTDSKKFSMRLDIQGKTVVIFGGAGFIGKTSCIRTLKTSVQNLCGY